jgi:ribosomal protein L13
LNVHTYLGRTTFIVKTLDAQILRTKQTPFYCPYLDTGKRLQVAGVHGKEVEVVVRHSSVLGRAKFDLVPII